MPRRRYVSPDFWDSPVSTAVSRDARLTLIGCWTLADDEGLLRWEPQMLRELLFAADPDVTDDQVRVWMRELVVAGAVVAYRAGKRKQPLGYLIGFERTHRTGRPKPSSLPPMPVHNVAVINAVAARDGSVCRWCRGPVPEAARRPEKGYEDGLPGEGGLDTVIDLLEGAESGGRGYPTNVVAAHARCVLLRNGRPAAVVDDGAPDGVFEAVARLARRVLIGEPGTDEHLLPVAVDGSIESSFGVRDEAATEVVSTDADAVLVPRSGIVGLSEFGNAGLTEFVVSPALLDSCVISEHPVIHEKCPLTCGNVASVNSTQGLSEGVVSCRGGLTAASPTEVEEEREMEGEKEGLRASRACVRRATASRPPHGHPEGPVLCAFGAGQEEDLTHSPMTPPAATRTTTSDDSSSQTTSSKHDSHNPDLSCADVVLEDRSQADAGGEDVTPEDPLFDVPTTMVRIPEPPTLDPDPEEWTPEQRAEATTRREGATTVLNEWWITHGSEWPQSYAAVYHAVMHAAGKGISPATLKRRLAEHAENQTRVTKASIGPKKPSRPVYATEERRKQATALLKRWWTVYGDGWAQPYGVVHRVLVALLANNVSEDDIKQAMVTLGRERKPISSGTVQMALSKTAKQVADDKAYETIAASRSADKYTQRTM